MKQSGSIAVVGIGPGKLSEMTLRAQEAIRRAEILVGYHVYIEQARMLVPETPCISTGMRGERERCTRALQLAEEGRRVALVSGGDSGVYGMAGLVLELSNQRGNIIPVEVIPGITAATAAASAVGAPLMHDFACISLSDLMTPLETIYQRIQLAAQADFVLCLYNPRSKGRPGYLARAMEILKNYRAPGTPVAVVKNAGREGETSVLSLLCDFDCTCVDMRSIVIIGNSSSYIENNKMITPRGYTYGRSY